MAFQQVNLGTANQGDGDSLRSGGDKVNDNFGELYNKLGSGSGAGATLSSGISATGTVVTLTSPIINTGISGTAIKDEDDMLSNSTTAVATQQSIKAFVDSRTIGNLNDVTLSSLADAQLIIYDNTQTRFENVTVSGDIAITNTGVTSIQANTITTAMIQANQITSSYKRNAILWSTPSWKVQAILCFGGNLSVPEPRSVMMSLSRSHKL
mgnify:CR=1 FL=1